MAKVVCENCKIEIEVPEGYNAPFLRCPDCGAIQKYEVKNENEPKFKILDKQGLELRKSSPHHFQTKPSFRLRGHILEIPSHPSRKSPLITAAP